MLAALGLQVIGPGPKRRKSSPFFGSLLIAAAHGLDRRVSHVFVSFARPSRLRTLCQSRPLLSHGERSGSRCGNQPYGFREGYAESSLKRCHNRLEDTALGLETWILGHPSPANLVRHNPRPDPVMAWLGPLAVTLPPLHLAGTQPTASARPVQSVGGNGVMARPDA